MFPWKDTVPLVELLFAISLSKIIDFCLEDGEVLGAQHIVEVQIARAEAKFQHLVSQKSNSFEEAVSAYRKRRGYSPPPGFDQWYRIAEEHDALVIEEFWDPIYEDLEPFHGVPPEVLRDAVEQVTAVSGANDIDSFWILNGTAGSACFESISCVRFGDMLKTTAAMAKGTIPNVKIPVNDFISPRMWAPWEVVESARQGARAGRFIHVDRSEVSWEGGRDTASMVKAACPPNSLARIHRPQELDPPETHAKLHVLSHMNNGVVEDYRLSKIPCHQPDLLSLHGTFVAPNYQLTTTNLFPLFSSQRVAGVNAEIRVPSSLYWSNDAEFYAADRYAEWSEKRDVAFWRGGNTGGRVSESNWQGFHRHRLVTMANATERTKIAQGKEDCHVPWAIFHETCEALGRGRAGETLMASNNKIDLAFSAFGCVEQNLSGSDNVLPCAYLDPYYHPVKFVSLEEGQKHRYLIDVDGNGFSGRFRSFMLSNSVPIKATIYDEWHDSRLVPWKHFVPMDNRFQDLWKILDYFLGTCSDSNNDESPDGDCLGHTGSDTGKRIGSEGALWAARVLRREDMDIYLMRLLLEYGRLYNRN